MQQTGIQHLVEYISYGLAYFYFLPSSMDKVFLVRCVLFAELFFFFLQTASLILFRCQPIPPSRRPCQMAGMLSLVVLYICRQLTWRHEWFRPDQGNNGKYKNYKVPDHALVMLCHPHEMFFIQITSNPDGRRGANAVQLPVESASKPPISRVNIYFAGFWMGANCLLHPVLFCTCQKSVAICMYLYLKLTRWNGTELLSSFSQWAAKIWLMVLVRGVLLLTFRERSSLALQPYFHTHKIHFTIYPCSSPLHSNAWSICRPYTCSMSKPPKENVVWGASSMIS